MVPRELVRYLRYQDGWSCAAVAELVGCSESMVRVIAPGRPGKVPNDKLRAAFLASRLTAAQVAMRVEWFDDGAGDGARVRRALGLQPEVNGCGRWSTRRLVDAEIVSRLAEAIGVMPWEVLPDDEGVSGGVVARADIPGCESRAAM